MGNDMSGKLSPSALDVGHSAGRGKTSSLQGGTLGSLVTTDELRLIVKAYRTWQGEFERYQKLMDGALDMQCVQICLLRRAGESIPKIKALLNTKHSLTTLKGFADRGETVLASLAALDANGKSGNEVLRG